MVSREVITKIKLWILGERDKDESNIFKTFAGINPSSILKNDLGIKEKIIGNSIVKIILTDMSGKENLSKIKQKNLINTEGLIFIYNVSSRDSFMDIDKWINATKDKYNKNIHKILVANNVESNNREVEIEEGFEYAEPRNMKFFEISGKDKKSVDDIILSLCIDVLNDSTLDKSDSFYIKAEDYKKKKQSKCC
jgi:Ras-related protein Rab-35